jgi:ADP-ribosylglycohydrolase
MLGAIIGDMCGSTYEFRNQKNIEKIKLFREGSCPTDDSVMTVAVARALMDTYGEMASVIKTALVDSMHYYGHLFPYAGYGRRFMTWLERCERKPYNSWGNGSGMRVSAAGWMSGSLEETLRAAKLTAEVTHDHPEGIKGAQTIASAIYLARTGKSKEEIRTFIEDNFYRLDFTLDEVRPGYEFDVSCQGSCPQAIEAFLEGGSFEDVILKSISVGGDSDTIAAMAGGIAEAYYGIPEAIADQAIELLNDNDYGSLVTVVKDFRLWTEYMSEFDDAYVEDEPVLPKF